jgi:tetratricopeptide (TPR) repeat protein
MVSQNNIIDFVGRENEISLYRNWLSYSTEPRILYVYDAFSEDKRKGGIGKTWLLQKFIALTKEYYSDIVIVTIDFFNVEDRDGLVIASRLVEAIKEIHPYWFPQEYTNARAEYEAAKKEGAESTAFRNRLVDALASDLVRLKPLLQDTKRSLLLFFDTFELIKDNPVIALLNPTQKFPDTYQFAQIGAVIAGRYEIDWDTDPNWQGRENEVKEVPLGAFTPEEMVIYNNKRCIQQLEISSEKTATLYRRTQGRPILVGLLTDIVNHQILTMEDFLQKEASPGTFDAYLVSQINRLENPINWVILFMAHAYHRFNENMLQWMLQKFKLSRNIPDIEYQAMLKKLLALSFVRRSNTGEDFVLHDEMRDLVIQYCWDQQDPGEENRKEISGYIIEYYKRELVREEQESARSQSYDVAMLYHKLFFDLKNGFLYFEQRFEEALKLWLHPYARSLLQETQKFNARLSQEQRYTLVMREASLLMREEKYNHALFNYQYLRDETESNWFIQHRSAVHYGLAECFLHFDEIPKALDNLEISQALEEQSEDQKHYANIMGMLGYIHQYHGSRDKAISFYIQSMGIYKNLRDLREYSDTINSLGNIYRTQGKIEDALQCCKVALALREKLFKQGKLGEVPVGLSFNTLAVIYLDMNDLMQANQHLERAFAIFKRLGYRRGLARVYNRQGQLHINDNPEMAMKLFQNAYDTAISIGATEEQINSLNNQGKVLLEQGQLEQAKEHFEQAISLSESGQDYYSQAESLLGLFGVLKSADLPAKAQETLEKLKGIALEYSYYNLLSYAENFQGERWYQEKIYLEAFKNFVRACHYMALFNVSHYNNKIRLVFDRLLAIPTHEEIHAILAVMRDYWSDQGLTKDYPELMHACEEAEILGL